MYGANNLHLRNLYKPQKSDFYALKTRHHSKS